MFLSYAELFCLSNFSFLKGASHPEELVERAAQLSYRALALTDECSLAGVVRAYLAAQRVNLPLIVGAHFWVEPLQATLIVLAHDRTGYGDLSAAISRARNRAVKGEYLALPQDFEAMHHCTGIVVCTHEMPIEAAQWLVRTYGANAALGVMLHRQANEAALIAKAESIGALCGLPRVALGGVRFHLRKRKALHDVLTAVRLRRPLSECAAEVLSNSEPHLRTRERLAAVYPLPWLLYTNEIAQRCTFDMKALSYEYPHEIVPEGHTPTSWLRVCTLAGARKRYPQGTPQKVLAAIEHELALIAELKAEAFFLTVYDVVNFARSRGILCQGRGSAANSAVCFCLGITEVDPDRTSVLFERFMSRERNEPPDIDVDFEHERREEVIQYIYRKYGRHRAALAAALICYRSKSALRDCGKALGLSLDQVDRLTRVIAWWDGQRIAPERLIEAGFEPSNSRIRKVLAMAEQLVGFPRHLSQHTGGFVIARDDLTRLVPVENAAMPERTVIQWDKDDLEALGVLKVDVLALGALTAIRKAIALINDFYGPQRTYGADHLSHTPDPLTPLPSPGGRGESANENLPPPISSFPLTVSHIPDHDTATFDMICRGDTLGVFQIESRAQMAMLPRLRPRCYYDLVIEVALVRPGPITGDMVHPYLRRRNGLEPVTYPSEAVREVLERTLGVSIFQEQVMQLAVVAAGFTPGEADQLRRAMAAWKKKGGLEPFEKKLMQGMLARGYSEQWAQQIYKQICGFGEYGFPESHAASFALLAYQAAWLKCHYPAAYAAALINSQPMGFYTPSQIVQDAARHGVPLRPVDVCVSDWDCTLERVDPSPQLAGAGEAALAQSRSLLKQTPSPLTPLPQAEGSSDSAQPALRLGLRLVKGLRREVAARIVAARQQAPFTSAEDLARRAQLDRHDLAVLTRADALHSLSGHRRQAYWDALGFAPDRGLVVQPDTAREPRPQLPRAEEGEEVIADYHALGLTLRAHPLALLRARLDAERFTPAQALRQARHRQIVRVCGLVTCRQRPETAKGVTFVTLEDETGMMNIVVWPDLGHTQRGVLLQAQLLTVFGQVQREGEVIHVVAGRLRDDSWALQDLRLRSRDFH